MPGRRAACYACCMKPIVKWAAGAGLLLALVTAIGLVRQRGTPVQLVQLVPVLRTGIVQSVVATGRLNAAARLDIGAEVTQHHRS